MATKTPYQIVSENVEILRKQQGLSQEAIGKAIGRSQSSADRKLKQATRWSLHEIDLMADTLGVTAGYLLQDHAEN